MSTAKFKFILEKSEGWGWRVWLSDGVQEVTIDAGFKEDVWMLVHPIYMMFWGIDDGWCSWMQEPGEYRWLFSRQGETLMIQILWFKEYTNHLDNSCGKTVFRMECDLLAFAKRLCQQLNQLSYQENPDAVLPESTLKLLAAIKTYEQDRCEQHQKVMFKKGRLR
jgi:hypothetical protein